MRREEAIMTLKELKSTVSDDEYTIFKVIEDDGYRECFDMAISALEREDNIIKQIEAILERNHSDEQ